jgi:hypothetical protein
LAKDKGFNDPCYFYYDISEKLQQTIRYYISNKGVKIIKKNYVDERVTQLEAGKWLQAPFINYIEKEFSDYDINYDYYLTKIRKEIDYIFPQTNQLTLNF